MHTYIYKYVRMYDVYMHAQTYVDSEHIDTYCRLFDGIH